MIVGKSAHHDREIFAIVRHADGWALEHNGEITEISNSKDEVRAAAHKRARAAHDAGIACQVTVSDEPGFFQAAAGGRR